MLCLSGMAARLRGIAKLPKIESGYDGCARRHGDRKPGEPSRKTSSPEGEG